VDPVNVSSPNVVSSDSATVGSLDGFAFRQDAATHGAASIDQLIVATTFGEAVPEPQTWVLIGIGSSFMLWNLRRRRMGKLVSIH
jgi:hypothetical protein